jgi:DNA-3-methyladenine glycosylase I
MSSDRPRCAWATDDPLMRGYHDREWGVAVHDDRRLFEFIVLEGAQAGLSWRTILARREASRMAFAGFHPEAVARFTSRQVERLLAPASGIVRNRRKVESAIQNARSVIAVAEKEGSFDSYVWRFVGGEPRQNAWRSLSEIPASTAESNDLSRDLLRRGFTFVGPTIVYAFMQAVGMVNDHLVDCFRYRELAGPVGKTRSTSRRPRSLRSTR